METGPLPRLSAAAVLRASNNKQTNTRHSGHTRTRTRIHTQRYLVTFGRDRRSSQIWFGVGRDQWLDVGGIWSPSTQPYLMHPLPASEEKKQRDETNRNRRRLPHLFFAFFSVVGKVRPPGLNPVLVGHAVGTNCVNLRLQLFEVVATSVPWPADARR